MPKIYATSDLHGQLPQIPDCDCLLIVGDVCPDFLGERQSATRVWLDNGHQQQAKWLDQVLRPWLIALTERDILVIAVWGNHDFVGEKRYLVDPLELPWTMLRDSGKTITFPDGEQLSIWGTPWVPNLSSWAFYATDTALEARASIIPPDIDILMTHGPPYGFGDMVGPKFGGPVRVGDKSLTRMLEHSCIPTVLCGHIHEDAGTHDMGNEMTVVRNVSYLNENYETSHDPVLLSEFLTYDNL